MSSKSNRWLSEYSENITSQRGEDGILKKVLETLGENDNWCVEFGAWDGIHYSNTHNLIKNSAYSAVLIEGSKKRFQDLKITAEKYKKIIPINAFVGFSEDDGLDTILGSTAIPACFDLLSIDIDGNDYHVWKALKKYKPKVVIIEFNPTIPSAVEFVQSQDMNISQGNSISSLDKLAKEKGYELVAATEINAIFVDEKYFSNFGINDNSVVAIRPNERNVTYIFNGYDGTVFIRGYGKMGWHHIPFHESRLQQLPKWLRIFPDNYSSSKKRLARLYRSLRKRKII